MKENLITDLPARVLGGFQAARGVGEGWIPFSFETEEYSGIGLAAGAQSGARELILDLHLKGAQILHFALGAQTSLRVWLDGDKGYREFVTQHGGENLQECRLHAQNLTGRKLHIAPKTGDDPLPAFLAYIRAETVEAEYSSARNLVATNDGWSWIALEGIETERDVWKFFEPLRDSDFGLMLWGPAGADVTGCHNTQVGTFVPTESTYAFRVCDRTYARNIGAYRQSGAPEILTTAVEAARDAGVKIHFYIRPEAFFAPFPYDGFSSQLFLDHPEWHCRDEFGEEIKRMSYAFSEVQDHMMKYCEELLEYSPDGLCFAFNRSLPMMICEEPVLQECERLVGRRPNLPDEVDSEDMIAARTSLMNEFLERVRELLSTRDLEFSCMVSPDEEQMRTSGLDLQGLASRGIFDSILVHSGGFHAASTPVTHAPFWKELQSKTRVYPNGWGGSYDHIETANFLKTTVLDSGFAGGFFWDTENFSQNPYNWEMIRRGGTCDYLASIIREEIKPPRIIPLTKIQGTKLGNYNPMRSY